MNAQTTGTAPIRNATITGSRAVVPATGTAGSLSPAPWNVVPRGLTAIATNPPPITRASRRR
jgi:hypothetical protein